MVMLHLFSKSFRSWLVFVGTLEAHVGRLEVSLYQERFIM